MDREAFAVAVGTRIFPFVLMQTSRADALGPISSAAKAAAAVMYRMR